MTGPAEIVLAEDNPSDAELVIESLRAVNLGAHVHIAHDGEEALDFLLSRGAHTGRAAEPSPKLVLLDIKLPKVDGFEVLRALKHHPRTAPIPVVMLTSSNVERDVARCYALGANSYVQKPVDFKEFRETIAQIGQYWLRIHAPPPPSAFTARRE